MSIVVFIFASMGEKYGVQLEDTVRERVLVKSYFWIYGHEIPNTTEFLQVLC